MDIQLNHDVRKKLYNGQWKFEASNGQAWIFYFRLGRLMWCEEKTSKEERLFRHLSKCYPQLNITESQLAKTDHQGKFLAELYKNKKIDKQTTSQIISNIAKEILFDIVQLKQTEEIVERQIPKNIYNLSLPLINIESVLEATEESWKQWKNLDLAGYSPNFYPIIRDKSSIPLELLKQIDGEQTIRRVAWYTNRDLLELTKVLVNLANSGAIILSEQPFSKNPQLQEKAKPYNRQELSDVPTEKTVSLEAIVTQFRGNHYIQENSLYLQSLEKIRTLLKEGNIVKLIVNFVGIKEGNTSLARELLNGILDQFQVQDGVELENLSELTPNQFSVRLKSEQSGSEKTTFQEATKPNNSKDFTDVPVEKTVTLEAVVTQFRGNHYVQKTFYYWEILNQIQSLLKEGNIVKLIVNFVGIKEGNTSLARELLNGILDQFQVQDGVELENLSELAPNQFSVRLKATNAISILSNSAVDSVSDYLTSQL